jgi:hypothetical protein
LLLFPEIKIPRYQHKYQRHGLFWCDAMLAEFPTEQGISAQEQGILAAKIKIIAG